MSVTESEVVIERNGKITAAPGDPARMEAFLPSPCVQNHAANIMPLKSGDILCAWFGGTQEGMADISIYCSRLSSGSKSWEDAVKLSDDPTKSEQNPVLFPAPDGKLWLLWTAQKSGNQDTAFVRYRISEDDGHTWGPIQALFGPNEGYGTFIRQPIVVLDNGEWLLPVFYCYKKPGTKWVGDDDTSAVKISSDQGQTWADYAVPGSTGCVHMNVEKLNDGTLLALFRSRWADNIYASHSRDNGRTWTEPAPTELPNNNSSIQFTGLNNGHLAIVYNHRRADQATERRASLYDEIEEEDGPEQEAVEAAEENTSGRKAFWGTPRAPMTLAISEDEGRTWRRKRDLEVGDGYCMTNNSQLGRNREFSYPSIKQGSDGKL
ncbi:MAG: exo-alpha-sialidase, partial [Acetobacteraceae bacterium]|nr:exo-alpha-sialidase [Acetobacteraceae bacterium]